jgi:hypothetical protein
VSRTVFLCDDGKCFVSFYRRHFLHFDYDLTVSQALLRHHSMQNLMIVTELETHVAILLFVTMVSVFSFCRRHFLHFDYDLTVSRALLRHHSMQNWMRNAVTLLDRHRVGKLRREPFFCDDGKCLVSFCRRHFFHFIRDLTVFQSWLRHQSIQNQIKTT